MPALIEACARIARSSRILQLDQKQVERWISQIDRDLLRLPAWDGTGMYRGAHGLAWLIAYNAINYCYWPDRGPRWWTIADGSPIGVDDEALGVMAAFGAALDRGIPLHDGAFLRSLDRAGLDALLPPAPGAGELPMMDVRLAALNELGRAYLVCGGPEGLIGSAAGSAPALVDRLIAACPSWEDSWTLDGLQLPFRKRAQLCVAMLYGYFQGAPPFDPSDVSALTAFADYRLPQVLRGAGILTLSEPLAERIARGEQIPAGSRAEIEIRAATVWGAELIRRALQSDHPGVTALQVDHLLWRTGVARQDELPPFHRTRGTAY